jgi:hypothetical protein
MIVPDFWAEARKQYKAGGKQVTVRRFGWSTTSELDAMANAQARADEALSRLVAGEKIDKREPKVPYNGAFGVPIREEVLARHGEQVITRNAYGAHCLNSPNALFADIDFEPEHSAKRSVLVFVLLSVVAIAIGLVVKSWLLALGVLFISIFTAAPLEREFERRRVAARGGAENIARAKILAFVSRNPLWNLRLYRTPAGYRILATHQSFEPSSSEAQLFFSEVSADPIYVQMCINQRCFRARLTAKPWRIGIAAHMRPRPGVWPVQPERIAVRKEWLATYEASATSYSACHYIESLGSGVVDESVRELIDLHDAKSRALQSELKLA